LFEWWLKSARKCAHVDRSAFPRVTLETTFTTRVVGLVGVQSNQFPRALDIARPLRAAGIPAQMIPSAADIGYVACSSNVANATMW
jgi:hypothetical protein